MSPHRRYIRRLKALAVNLVGAACWKCGRRRELEFAHAKPTGLRGMGRGSGERYRDILAHPDCYVRACKTCHPDV